MERGSEKMAGAARGWAFADGQIIYGIGLLGHEIPLPEPFTDNPKGEAKRLTSRLKFGTWCVQAGRIIGVNSIGAQRSLYEIAVAGKRGGDSGVQCGTMDVGTESDSNPESESRPGSEQAQGCRCAERADASARRAAP